MNYTIRPMREDEYPLLRDFLYEAIFIPEGTEPPPRSIIDLPELQVYIDGFGSEPSDICLVAEADEGAVGAESFSAHTDGNRREAREEADKTNGESVVDAEAEANCKIVGETDCGVNCGVADEAADEAVGAAADKANGRVVGAETDTADGKVVGAVWVRIMNDYGHIADDVPSFAISLYKDFRGQGIGTALMQKMLAELRERGFERASLAVQKANFAVKLYENTGFKIIDQNAEEYIMVCNLA